MEKSWNEKKKTGKADVAFPVLATRMSRRKRLEVDPQPELQLPGVIALLVDHAEFGHAS